MASKPEAATAQTVSMAQAQAPVHDAKKGLSMTEQYARVRLVLCVLLLARADLYHFFSGKTCCHVNVGISEKRMASPTMKNEKSIAF